MIKHLGFKFKPPRDAEYKVLQRYGFICWKWFSATMGSRIYHLSVVLKGGNDAAAKD